ncbi:MAG TPA: arginine--tRNA ligase [Candidatus Binatia bacterium]|nr:arginine--tRNA ligase [Candidatus Binatia bacterium]
MPTITQLLEAETSRALGTATGTTGTTLQALVHPTANPKFGDYQANGVMAAAKAHKLNSRELAQKVTAQFDPSEIPATWEIAGPGFINFRLDPVWLGRTLLAAALDERSGMEPAAQPETIVLDFSAPNIAKPMHVGHIRSTILGDALTRVLRFLGHTVITDNHLGDWGTQFGMLIVGYRTLLDRAAYERDPLAEMERIYKAVQAQSNTDPTIAARAREELAKLQKGDRENTALWREFMAVSRQAFEQIYSRLDVQFDHWLGESFYNSMLPETVRTLQEKGLARLSEGAICIFFDDDPELVDTPFLIQKQDGAFLYATTDLATVQYRAETFHPDRIIYVTDSRQQLHFRQLFAATRRWGYTIALEHVWFGTILGEDGKPIKTREGEPIKLEALLDEAEERARAIARDKNPSLSEADLSHIARVVGIGAVKYADLMQNRTADYRFSWDKMLALDGNTAPYLQYVYARIRSIFRKGKLESWHPEPGMDVNLLTLEELDLAKQMIRWGDTLLEVERTYKPNLLATFLYDLATKFNLFYQAHAVLKAPEDVRPTRLLLCDLTARYIRKGLELLGIETLEAM